MPSSPFLPVPSAMTSRLLRLFLGGIRDDDTSADLLFFLDVLNEHAIADGLDFDVSHMWVGFWV